MPQNFSHLKLPTNLVALAILGDRQGRKQRTEGRGLNGAFADYTLIKSLSLSLSPLSTPLPPWFYLSTFLPRKPFFMTELEIGGAFDP